MAELSRHDDHLAAFLLEQEVDGGAPLKDILRFDHSKQQWHVWDGMRWAPDKTRKVYDLLHRRAKALVAAAMDAGNGEAVKALMALLDTSKKDSVLKAMSAWKGVAMAGDEWDPDPTLLAFTNGVLDLKTLAFNTEPSPDLLLSRSTRQKYDPEAQCPRFSQFLQEVMGGDEELIVYLAAVLGYAMFGFQREQKFWMWVGQGQNGKGTLAKIMSHVLGDYAEKPSDELYMRTRFGTSASDKPRPDLLRLQGARWTWMSEPQGGQFNEELLKAHTGDDPITARDLYGKASSFTTFRPSHTVVFLTNNPPRTDDVGPSMQRRVRIVKFEQDFRGEKEDKGLEQTLKGEAPGILALLTRMANRWFLAGGLPEPERVTEWSNEYIEENDPLAAFVTEACAVGPLYSCSAALMWTAYQDWAARRDVDAGTQTGFGLAMARRFKKHKKSTGWVYLGVRAKSAAELIDVEE